MSLLEDVARRLARADVDGDVTGLALAACRSSDELARLLAAHHGHAATAAGERPAPQSATPPTARPPAGPTVHLREVAVAGFRGIGPRQVLELEPRPGLTLVVGRNGSGKSSFAEAVEFALTGDNRRWARRSRVWRDGWRNLHQSDPAGVEATFVEGDDVTLRVARRWEPDARLDDHALDVHRDLGTSVEELDLDELGWLDALDLYRPFLPYTELGTIVDDGPTALHDTLYAVLGLDVLTDAVRRLREERLERQRGWKAAVESATELADDLDHLDDPRAAEVATLLRVKDPDPGAVAAIAGGDVPTLDPGLDVLRVLVGLPGPDVDAVRHAADALDDAVDLVRASSDGHATHDLQVADLLEAARRLHAHTDDQPCPVCGEGRLDAAWEQRSAWLVAQLRANASAVRHATDVLATARRVLGRAISDPPASLHRAGMADLDAAQAIEAWEALAATRDVEDDRERAVQARRRVEAVTTAMADLRRRAKIALVERTDEWAPTARRLATWVGQADAAHHAVTAVPRLKAAEKALNTVLDHIRAERWTPIAAQARGIWEQLGQDSSVVVEEVSLAGTGTRRRVEVEVTVDGILGAALGVMSQGELHALALSLFLPRATLPESPFGFIVIDDPVQSMDSIRVDGLARVLQDAARQRQVVVFTHDERLRTAVHRRSIPATIIEVDRGAGSTVELRQSIA